MVNAGYNMGKKLETLRGLLYEMDSAKQNVFQEGPAPLTMEEKRAFVESLRTFSQLGESVYSKRQLEEAVNKIERMVETAQRHVNESSADVVESTAAGRHFKYMTEALKEFKKAATEVVINERKCAQAYEDIAEGLKKYYDIG
jgi:predicted DNA-binding transcriptional regulator YafY